MTRIEFSVDFARLCKGFSYAATEEQTEAWFQNVGHIGPAIWTDTVTTVLCQKHFPNLEEVRDVIEKHQEAARRATVLRDQPAAARAEEGVSRNLKEWRAHAQQERDRPTCGFCRGFHTPDRLCWPWLSDEERERRLRLPYWVDRRRPGLTILK